MEFLFAGYLEVFENWDNIMTPNTLVYQIIQRDNWTYYQVDPDEFYYSVEPPGIQMVFNEDVDPIKARQIANEILDNIWAIGQQVKLIEVNGNKPFSFNI